MTTKENPEYPHIKITKRASPSSGGWIGDIRTAALYAAMAADEAILEEHNSMHVNNTDGPLIGGMAAINDDLVKAKAGKTHSAT